MSAERWQGRAGVVAFVLVMALAIASSPTLVRFDPAGLTNDEAMYAWKAARIAESPSFLLGAEAWRRHPPFVPLVAALLAQAMPLENALAWTANLSLAAALAGIALFASALAGPVAGATAATLLALDENVREFAAHVLLDLPLLALLFLAGVIAVRGGRLVRAETSGPDRLSLAALPVAALACGVKSYGTLVLGVFVAAIVWERLAPRWRRLGAGAAILLGVAVASAAQLGWLRERWYWLAPHDPLRTGAAKLYLMVQSFQWISVEARARTLALLCIPVALLAGRFLRFDRRAHARLLAFAVGLPLLAVLATRVVEKRTLFLVLAPVHVALGIVLARAAGAIPGAALRRGLLLVLALAAPLLVLRNERGRLPPDACRYAGRAESAHLLREALRPGDRVFSTATHQHRWYGGLEFEKDGGPLYGENEWTGVPHDPLRFEQELARTHGSAFLALGWNRDTNPAWLVYDEPTAARLRSLGFALQGAVWLPESPSCERPSPARAAAEEAFHRAFGLARARNVEGRAEYLAAVVLRRTSPTVSP